MTYLLYAMAVAAATGQSASVEYLSEANSESILYSIQGWGGLGLNTAVVPPDGRTPVPLRVKDTAFANGLGHHAPGEIVVDLGGAYDRFQAAVGVQWQEGRAQQATVTFEVYVDGKKRFESGVMREGDAARAVDVDVRGASLLRLVSGDAGDGIMFDCANWADARLVRSSETAGVPDDYFDAAPFGRVVTWDPRRVDGARSNRIQEFRDEDVYLERPVRPVGDLYAAPVSDGLACIGLQWAEARILRKAALTFADTGSLPDVAKARVEYWNGESPWQGKWTPLRGAVTAEGRTWAATISPKTEPDFPKGGVPKIRWVFEAAKDTAQINRLSALTRVRMAEAAIRLEFDAGDMRERPLISVYNGSLVTSDTGKTDQPLELRVRYTRPMPWKTDRTLLRLVTPMGGCSLAVEDVLNGPLYVRDLGVFAVSAEATEGPRSAAEYKAAIKGRKTVLERVREMPDQTLAAAMEKTHNPIQDKGPMMVSLACDNRKCVAHEDGSVAFSALGCEFLEKDAGHYLPYRLTPRFGDGTLKPSERRLRGDWLPVPEMLVRDKDLVCRETVYVAPGGRSVPTANGWLYDEPVCVVEYAFENPSSREAQVRLALGVAEGDRAFPVTALNGDAVFTEKGRVLAYVDLRTAAPLACAVSGDSVSIGGALAAGARAVCYAYLPLRNVLGAEYVPPANGAALFDSVKAYWERALADAAQVETPDAFLNNVIKASQVHCLIAARNEQDGANVAAWISADRYGPLESEAHSVIYGMDLMGQAEFAKRSLDFFVKRYNAQGYLTTGYTLMGTGWHLWTLARHYALTEDKAWFEAIAPRVTMACQWTADQRLKTMAAGLDAEQTPEYGLVPPGVAADWNRFAYRFAAQAHYYAGLAEASRLVSQFDRGHAQRLVQAGDALRQDIIRAFEWNNSRSPALPLSNGEWIPAYNGMLYGFGTTGEMIPGEDGNRSWAYDVELGAHHLVPLGVLPADSRATANMMDHMEDVWFLHQGMCDYPEARNHEDWFNQGGFAKVQPYYARNAEICALRDDVKPFIRSYFNAMASMVSRENLSFWEHFYNTAGWNKTHETGWFLVQTRTMFVQERADELWLAPFVTDRWMEDGGVVAVTNAPTRFGPVSYRIVSVTREGRITATITPPARTAPSAIVLRVRHPEGKPIKSATRDGRPITSFDTGRECVRLEPADKTTEVCLTY